MKPILILTSSQPPQEKLSEWYTIWCIPKTFKVSEADNVDQVITLPGNNISSLCVSLFAIEYIDLSLPVALCTENSFVNKLSMIRSKYVNAYLNNTDSGVIWFPMARQLRFCGQSAIKFFNPSQGHATLNDLWNQAMLVELQ
ncbi:hypothetical protein [Scandinavium goeteborgense]|uniref:hypothetical protein n=1 Tax=Scandinavium goeteborgense TaxID=1851514 RepID=UPI000F68A0FB|nr:hypothetical protein [Scandinavium goeteborgense]QKN79788.1 hypothetical protein A8O29_000175 [Scandinavium goeteborgense]